jgi:SNF family Na+-dependent transporter
MNATGSVFDGSRSSGASTDSSLGLAGSLAVWFLAGFVAGLAALVLLEYSFSAYADECDVLRQNANNVGGWGIVLAAVVVQAACGWLLLRRFQPVVRWLILPVSIFQIALFSIPITTLSGASC